MKLYRAKDFMHNADKLYTLEEMEQMFNLPKRDILRLIRNKMLVRGYQVVPIEKKETPKKKKKIKKPCEYNPNAITMSYICETYNIDRKTGLKYLEELNLKMVTHETLPIVEKYILDRKIISTGELMKMFNLPKRTVMKVRSRMGVRSVARKDLMSFKNTYELIKWEARNK